MNIAILTGPTAAGKTAFALDFCEAQGIEIINADSLLVYRDLNIGTAKPSDEELARVPHHLVNIRSPNEPYTAGDFRRDVVSILADLKKRGKRGIIVGGTGFYLKAITHGMWDAPASSPQLRSELELKTNEVLWRELLTVDAPSAEKIGVADRYRLIRALEIFKLSSKPASQLEKEHTPQPVAPYRLLWIDRDPSELEARIEDRTDLMLKMGLLDEVQALLARYGRVRPLESVGYAECVRYLEQTEVPGRKVRPGLLGLKDEIVLGTRQLVKRQRTWLRGQTESEKFILDADASALQQALQEIYHSV